MYGSVSLKYCQNEWKFGFVRFSVYAKYDSHRTGIEC